MCAGMAVLTVTLTTDAEAALAHAFFHAFQQIHRFQFLNVDVGVADDAERMRFQHLHAGEQLADVRGDDLLQPHKVMMIRHGAVFAHAARRAP